MTFGVVLALCSALVWGSGDFCGGRASTRLDAFQVLGLSALSGIVMLGALTLATGEAVRLDRSMLWAVAAGLSSALGIVALYHGLSVGSAAVVAPAASVIAASIPVVYGMFTHGMPRPIQMTGFGCALVGIFLVTRSVPSTATAENGIRFGVLAGFGFGGFLVMIGQVHEGAVYVPLAVARTVMLGAAIAVLAGRSMPFPGVLASPIGLLAGVLDAGGTALYMLAEQYVRLDVAAVLSSFYPAATVLLARIITREQVTALQWAGAGVCVVAVALIAG
jgi:drug/metabolite transporter (DMT)-like permease